MLVVVFFVILWNINKKIRVDMIEKNNVFKCIF